MRMEGIMATQLLDDDQVYMPYLTYEKGKPVIYAYMLKALYSTLRVVFVHGKTPLLQDTCELFPTKQLRDHNAPITWHVYDSKMSHKQESVVSSNVDQLVNQCGQLGTQFQGANATIISE